MNRRVRTLVVSIVVAVVVAVPGLGFVGMVVFDAANLEQNVRQLVQMIQEYEQLVQTYEMIRNQYDHMRRMAERVPVDMATRYRSVTTPWKASSASDIHGITGGWMDAINTASAVSSGYSRATERLNEYGAALNKIPADQLERVKTSYATVELTDGSNQHMVETLGRLRTNAPGVERVLQGLEEDSLSSDPAMNTEVAILNKINAASVIALRSAQDTNKLLVALTEAHVIEAKRKRDAEARAINHHIRFIAEGKDAITAQGSGISEAMKAWRIQ